MARPTRLILASGSLGRRELLKLHGCDFEVHPADVEEPTGEDATDIRRYVQEVSWMKAAAVAPRYDDALVLSADTVAWIDNQVVGKPADEADARRILRLLGGREHELWTGVTLWRRPGDMQVIWQEVTRVFFAKLSDEELDRYLATRTWRGCSGAYAVQMENDPYVRIVEGSVSNVIGLPMESLARNLAEFFPRFSFRPAGDGGRGAPA
jgi:septum formation protein